MRVVDILLSVPILYLLIVLAVILTPSLGVLILVIGFTAWLVPARLVRGETLSLRVRERKTAVPLACAVTLIQAVPKGKIIESIIQKATELGVARIVPILSERVVTQLDHDGAESKAEKWQHVAIEAIKQCECICS